MRTVIKTPTAAVLSNRGVPVSVHKVDAEGARLRDEDGEHLHTTRHVQFTAYTLACLEDTYGGMEGFQKALDERPNKTLIETYGLLWDLPPRTAGQVLVDGMQASYATALATSLMHANGMGGEDALKLLYRQEAEGGKREAAMRTALEEMLADDDDTPTTPPPATAPGPRGSGPGSKPAALTTSSGALAPPR